MYMRMLYIRVWFLVLRVRVVVCFCNTSKSIVYKCIKTFLCYFLQDNRKTFKVNVTEAHKIVFQLNKQIAKQTRKVSTI